MSKIKQGNGDDHPEAAVKHLIDASALLSLNRFDGAAYLSGYIIECALKSILIVESARAWGHVLQDLSNEALRLAALPGAKTSRYIPKITVGHAVYDPGAGWRETLRYAAQGTITDVQAQSWLAEAQAVYESTIAPMRLDGVV